ncbi:hypothetical protein GCM10027020_06460 [Nocardioides salsibiostraticola]
MRIEEVRANAFGPYQDQTLTLTPGMNIFHGPNEAGKSSWFAALYAGLAGQRKPRTHASGHTEFASRHRPWTGSRWSAGVVVAMDDGTRLAFTQDLRSGRSEISDIDEGKDLTIEELEARFGVPLTTESVLDGTRLVGLNRYSARATTFIGQADVLRVLADADELREAMERVAVSETDGFDADAALNWLRERRSEIDDPLTLERRTGDARTTTARGLAQLARLNEVIAEEWAAAREKALSQQDLDLIRSVDRWADINRLAPRLAAARDLQTQIDATGTKSSAAATDADADAEAVTSAYDTLITAQALLDEHSLAAPPPTSLDLPEQFTGQQLDQYADLLESSPPPVDEALAAERVRLREGPADEAEVDLAWVRYHETVERNVAARKAHKAALKQHAKQEKAYRAERAAFEKANGVRAAVSEWQVPTFFGGVLIAEILIFAFVSNVLGLVIGVLGIIGLLFLRRSAATPGIRPSSDQEVADLETDDSAPTPPGPAPAEPDYESEDQPEEAPGASGERVPSPRLLELDALLSAQEAELARQQAERDDVVASLEQAGIEPSPSAIRALIHHMEENATVRATREGYTVATRHLIARRDVAATALAGLLQRRIVAPVDQEQVTTLIGAYEDAAETRPTPGAHGELIARLDQLLDGSTIDEFEERLSTLETDAGPEPSSVPPDMESFRGRARDRHDQVTERLGDFRGQRAGLSQSLPAPAELIEAERETQRHLARSQDFGSLLDAAESELRLARDRARANIAPAVEARIRPWLPRVTRGRYIDATVSPDELTIQVTDQAGQVREAELLSQGTTEQVFLLLRVALAQVLGGGVQESTPIVLDDVTVQSDQSRTFAILELLHELSADHQVVMFTQEHEVITWARENLDRDTDQLMALTPASDLTHSQRALL